MEKAKATKYTCAIIFTKRGNLNAYLNTDKVSYQRFSGKVSETYKEYCAREREIQLILLTRYDGDKHICRIKCPVSPLPVKGEFEVPSFPAIERYLVANGWTFKQKIYPRMFE